MSKLHPKAQVCITIAATTLIKIDEQARQQRMSRADFLRMLIALGWQAWCQEHGL